MITIKSKDSGDVKDRVDRKRVDDDYSTKYFKREFDL